jgi:hypothetical protein
MHNEYIFRKCPACDSDPPELAEIASEIEAENLLFEEAKRYWVGLFTLKSHFSYFRCQSCGLLFNKYYFDANQLSELYSNLEPNMHEVPRSLLLKTQKGYFDKFKKYSKLSGNYLEIGPDVGLFIESSPKDSMNFERYYLYEPNISVHCELKKLLNNKTINLSTSLSGYKDIKNDSINDVVMIHVFDHMTDPYATLITLKEKMISGATLSIVTHDEGSLLRKIIKQKWPPFCMSHPQIYNEKSIKNILTRAGFTVRYCGKTKNFFSINYLVRHLLWLCGIKTREITLFGNLSIGLKLGNIITISTKN